MLSSRPSAETPRLLSLKAVSCLLIIAFARHPGGEFWMRSNQKCFSASENSKGHKPTTCFLSTSRSGIRGEALSPEAKVWLSSSDASWCQIHRTDWIRVQQTSNTDQTLLLWIYSTTFSSNCRKSIVHAESAFSLENPLCGSDQIKAKW